MKFEDVVVDRKYKLRALHTLTDSGQWENAIIKIIAKQNNCLNIEYVKYTGQQGKEVFAFPAPVWSMEPIYEEWDQ